MATRQSRKVEPPKVIGVISNLAGAFVGTTVVAGRGLVKKAVQMSEGTSGKPKKKSARASAVKTKPKTPKVKKKKKGAKRKSTGSPGKAETSEKKSAQAPAKKTKGATPKKKTAGRKTTKTAKSRVSSQAQKQRISQAITGANAVSTTHEPQMAIAKAEIAASSQGGLRGV